MKKLLFTCGTLGTVERLPTSHIFLFSYPHFLKSARSQGQFFHLLLNCSLFSSPVRAWWSYFLPGNPRRHYRSSILWPAPAAPLPYDPSALTIMNNTSQGLMPLSFCPSTQRLLSVTGDGAGAMTNSQCPILAILLN